MPTRADNKLRSSWPIVLALKYRRSPRHAATGQDPNSFFVQGGDALEFQSLVEAAQP